MPFMSERRTARLLSAAQGFLLLDLPRQALEELRRVGDPGVLVYEYHFLRAETHRALAQWSDALDEFRMCYELQPKNLDVLMGLAWCYKRVDQLPQAIAVMLEAYRTHADVPVVLYNIACYYALAGRKQPALSWLGRALRKDRELLRLIPAETDFNPLRHDPDFHRLLELAQK
jgi:tetratricopeptide (TPR) repeat protein